MRAVCAIFGVLAIYAVALCQGQGAPYPFRAVIPQPATFSWDQANPANVTLAQRNKFTFQLSGIKSSVVLKDAFGRYLAFLFDSPYDVPATGVPQITTLNVQVQSDDESLFLGVDESYSMTVQAPSSTIIANTVFGALRALETFAQLVDYATNMTIAGTPIKITDAPRFAWRGLMIDTSRHYLPVPLIMHILDAMSFHKFNTMHWHIVDEASFPLEVAQFPLLSQKGAWSPRAIYKAGDIKSIVDYAYLRGIRVVPEVDMPSHTRSWGNGYPDIMPNCSKSTYYGTEPGLDPTKAQTFQVISGILSELSQLFPDPYMHLGGDEVNSACYQEDAALNQWMQSHGMGANYTLLLQYFVDNVKPIYTTLKKNLVCWSDLVYYSDTVDKETAIVQAWRARGDAISLTKLGYKTINSAGWYLDVQQPGSAHYAWIDTWTDFYNYDPTVNMTAQELSLFVGGEACMWGEAVDRINWDQRVWPRASPLAERLWSPATVTDINNMAQRMVQFRCQTLVRRGISAEPITPDWCSYEF
eukprot:TRINITY_DN2358_c0_g1_i5.p1 TRINITY_DN2358_c0_g1~~TRINITY_DN2358_c0_g1_i5.p1  ORF type:complete len:528 (-),score=136.47 TRINITY_DN2358_c0_g1_i5:22-1605(-)